MPRKNHKTKQKKPEPLKIHGIPTYRPKLRVAEDVVPKVVHHLPDPDEGEEDTRSDIRTRRRVWG